ncbi:MAG TPA: NAD(P)H-hydrate dehydratase [Thermoanaerobaculia bacterium]|jgi:NAD(P)H-hydrate epimerase
MIPVLDARGMRAADAETIRAGVASDVLMENAASALCEELRRRFPRWKRVVVVCGPGNNGGDGLAAARMLAQRGLSILLFTLQDPSAYTGDPAANVSRVRAAGVSLEPLTSAGGFARLRQALSDCDGVVDALFGTGLTRPLEGGARRAVEAINATGKPVVAADVPSGVSADRGALLGAAVRASLTVSFGAPKACHVFPPASEVCGCVAVADIGIPRKTLAKRARRLWLAEEQDVRALLPPRPLNSHKADFGRLAIVAGARGKVGAAVLVARGALRGGAGLVTVFCAASLEATIVTALPEAMTSGLPEADGSISESAAKALIRALRDFDAAVLGPGLGTSAATVRFLAAALKGARLPIVADADCLNAFAGRPEVFARRRAPTILTPHPGEAARLLRRSSRQIQEDRLGAARMLARRSRAVVILKGAHSLIADPSGEVIVNPTGTPLLATAGSGDVLAGLIGALVSGGLPPKDAAVAATWLHGSAAEALRSRLGDAGALAHEVADALPAVRRRLGRPRDP